MLILLALQSQSFDIFGHIFENLLRKVVVFSSLWLKVRNILKSYFEFLFYLKVNADYLLFEIENYFLQVLVFGLKFRDGLS